MRCKTKKERITFVQEQGQYHLLSELAEIFGCTAENARQICNAAGVKRLTHREALRELRKCKQGESHDRN